MPLPIAAVIMEAMNASRALSGAMKAANTVRRAQTGAKMPRAMKAADEMRNARRRFSRQAERYVNEARKAEGALRTRYENLARDALSDALSTYAEGTPASKYGKDIKELLNTLGDVKAHPSKTAEQLIRESYSQLRGASRADAVRRAKDAQSILNSPVGSRIYGATVDIWKGAPDINRALMEYFETDDMMGVIEKFESEFGENLYRDTEQQEKYDEIIARGQAMWVA